MGRNNAHIGQPDVNFSFAEDNSKIAPIIPTVPRPICQLKISPNNQMPKIAANTGVVELMVEESVGPKYLMPATERLADRDGRKIPTRTKIKTVEFRK